MFCQISCFFSTHLNYTNNRADKKERSNMRFTRFHWSLCFLMSALACSVFFLAAKTLPNEMVFFAFSAVCGLYALISLYQVVFGDSKKRLNRKEDALLYKSSCPSCGEPLAGHELYCPKCNVFLPKNPKP